MIKKLYKHFLTKAKSPSKGLTLAFATVWLFATGIAQAQTPIFVKATGTAGTGASWDSPLIGYAGLQAAVTTAGTAGNHIYVAAGNYTVPSGQTLLLIQQKTYRITGGYPASATGTDISGYNPVTNLSIIDGTSATLRAFEEDQTASGNSLRLHGENIYLTGLQFNNFKIDGAGYDGGAIMDVVNNTTFSSTHIFKQCSFKNNSAKSNDVLGGGAFFYSNPGQGALSVTFESCYFENNSSVINSTNVAYGGNGGALYFGGNSLYGSAFDVVINNSTFSGNKAGRNGGAIYFNNGSSGSNTVNTAITNSFFCSNSAAVNTVNGGTAGYGGALYIYQRDVVNISNSTFLDNNTAAMATSWGGAIYSPSGGASYVTIDGSLFNGNMNYNNLTSYASDVVLQIQGSSFVSNSYLQEAQAKYTTAPNRITLAGNHYSGDLTGTTLPEGCPTSVSSNNLLITNTCPATTVDLTPLHTATVPDDAELVWYDGEDPDTAILVTNPAAVGAGTYYAFYYDSTNDCYSPASTPVVVTIEDCVSCTAGENVLWYKADKGVNSTAGVPADNTQLTTWYDLATAANGAQNGGLASVHPGTPAETDLPSLPYYRYDSGFNFNYNPVLHFDAANNGQAVQFETPAKGCQTVFTVFRSAGVDESTFYASGLLYGGDVALSDPTDGDGIPKSDLTLGARYDGELIVGGGSDGDFYFGGDIELNNIPSIGTLKRDRRGDEEVYLSMYADGSTEIADENADPSNTLTGEGRDLINRLRIGKAFTAYEEGLGSPWGKLDGTFAELIVYDHVLTEADRAKVESYLAIKYGITLTGGTKQFGVTAGNLDYDYVDSDGTVVRTSEATYKYDIFGLGRDDHFELDQRISKSVNPGDILSASTNSDFTQANLDDTRTAINGDKEFLLFGNNGGSGEPVSLQSSELPAGISERFNREWKASHANTDGSDIANFSLRFDLTGITLTGANAGNVKLLIDTDGDGDFTTGTVTQLFPAVFTAGTEVIFTDLNIENGQVFTLGILAVEDAYCTKPGVAGTPLASSVGILTKGSTPSVSNWPQAVPNGYLVLDAAQKGMVITHMTTAQRDALTPVEGMMIYNTTESCVQLYRGSSPLVDAGRTGWNCIEQGCDSTPMAPRNVKVGYTAGGFNFANQHPNFLNQLNNTANYGASGIFKGIDGFDFSDAWADVSSTTVTAAQLKAKYDMIVTGYSEMSAVRAGKLKEYTDLGGVLFALMDAGVGTNLNVAFGGGTIGSGGSNAPARTLNNAVSNGIFGTGGGVTIIGAQNSSRPAVTNIPSGAYIVGYTNYPDATSTVNASVYTTGTEGRAIFVYDEGIFRHSSVAGTVVDTPQEVFIHNLMAYALQKVGFSTQ